MAGVLAAIVVLIVTSFTRANSYYYTVQQFRALGSQAVGRDVQVNGVPSSQYTWDAGTQTLRFTVAAPGVRPLPVVYHGAVPDGFVGAPSVVVAGSLGTDGVFHANQMLIKCPSKYVAAKPGATTRPSPGNYGSAGLVNSVPTPSGSGG
jgi:cytochrome c-type biogenesis protein CcmE